ncbi:hypothetical protein EH223_20070 [candidate division KSB1 bacterium]|nr:hypothetical protein [candidate division KSB1 bacterium]RQW00010.1 MAG: hypothetical protein EH223_20070 [candidate division KSB1 bacterium]
MRNSMLFLLILVLSATVFAADFSGTWILNREKSELGEGRGGRMAAAQMVVVQAENTLKIERTVTGRDGEERVMTEEMTLDGKETKTSGERGETINTAKMETDVLTINTVRKFERNGETFEMTSEQKWTMEGDMLVVNSKTESSRGTRELKLVYDKK